jgi:transcription termination factor Rho
MTHAEHTANTADPARSSAAELLAALHDEGAAAPPNLSRGELLAALQQHRLAHGREVLVAGAFELLPEGFGFLRSPHFDYEASPHDAFLSPSLVRSLNLKSGHYVTGPVRAPRGNERFFSLARIDRVNGSDPTLLASRIAFAARTPIVGTRNLALPAEAPWRALATLAPWCRGQRVLVQAPAGWPRAPWLADLALALRRANADARAFVCLLDQRPEDLAAAKLRTTTDTLCEVAGSTFDQPPERHANLAELVLARAQREVEAGHDVVLLLDSLTALTHAAQRAHAPSGRWLCPGLDAQAVLPGKRVFAAARACAEGGSLTVIAVALAAGDSAVDAAVLAESAHRGNSDVAIDPELAAAEAPAPFDAQRTRTRPEDDDRDAAARAAARSLRERLAAAAPEDRARLLAEWR